MKPKPAFCLNLSPSFNLDDDVSTANVTVSTDKQNLFPSLGEVAERTDALPDSVQEEVDDGREMKEVESLCMRCHEQGVTRLLLTTIPYFKEIIVSSFHCDHCGFRDTEIQSAGEIQPKGCVYTVHLLNREDLQRQIVKSSWGTVTVPELQLTIPPGRGQLSTIEGILRDTVRDLAIEQPVRRHLDPPTAAKIDGILGKIRDVLGIEEGDEDGAVGRDGDEAIAHEGEGTDKPFEPFTLTLDDPSGTSFLAFKDSVNDPQWNLRAYNRTLQQNVFLGLVAAPEDGAKPEDSVPEDHRFKSAAEAKERAKVVEHEPGVEVPEEVYSFPSTCRSCGHELETLMKQINIPYFSDVILMSANCYNCGYRDNEVKSSGQISSKGKRITLKVEAGDEDALSRDLLKSDTCGLEIPEIDLELQPGTLGGRFTTLEGLLNEIYDELSTKVFKTGDSSTAGLGQAGQDHTKEERNFEHFLQGLKDVMAVKIPFTLILDDALANSYLQNLNAPEPDPDMEIVEYERTQEQNDDLGLSDMVVEGYNPEAEGTAK
ncbi:nucleolar zinc-finger protein [Vanrija albida]|uniref:Nucleolar zinc-finger protein n=1 Tax=Vanrija albida TaxID=181172 RepID=A0ABR3PX43_9TREE